MVRVKLLHQLLWQLVYGQKQFLFLEEKSSQNVPNEKICGYFKWTEVLKRMPIETYLQIIGHSSELEGLKECADKVKFRGNLGFTDTF